MASRATDRLLLLGLAVALAAILVYLLARLHDLRRRERSLGKLLEKQAEELAVVRAALAASSECLEDQTVKDHVTGLYNRHHFDRLLDAEWRRAIRSGRPLALIKLEIDEFPAFVDTYGRKAGDECLTRVASAIIVAHRAGDLLAYHGDATFGAILPETDLVGALLLAERMRGRVGALSLRHAASTTGRFVTLSIGVATTIPALGSSCARLLAAATDALGVARSQGRDRVVPANVSQLPIRADPEPARLAGS